MNAALEMSIWLVASLTLLTQIQIPGVDSLSTVYHHSSTGRKLFGGYRIVPKTCSSSGTDIKTKKSMLKHGICMFNYECTQRGGEMIGSCVDGFLFGACCSLPQTITYLNSETNEMGVLQMDDSQLGSSTSSKPISSYSTSHKEKLPTTTSHRPSIVSSELNGVILGSVFTGSEDPDYLFGSFMSAENQAKPQEKPLLGQYLNNENQGGFIDNHGFLPVHKYPGAETVLLNPDGSFVVDEADPEVLFKRPDIQKIGSSGPHNTAVNIDGTGSLGPLGGFYGAGSFPVDKPSETESFATEKPFLTTPRIGIDMKKTTKATPPRTEKYPVTEATQMHTSSDLVLVHTISQTNKTTRPTPPTSKASTKFAANLPRPTVSSLEIDHHYPGYHYESYMGISKPPIVITSPVGFDGSGQAISHIIGILNNSQSKPVGQVTSENNSGLSTWLSITGDKIKNKYPTGTTKFPDTITSYVHGPSFTVEENENKPVPTVIVISPPSTAVSPGSHRPEPEIPNMTKKPVVKITEKPGKYPTVVQVLPAGEESLINFPPVRNPDLNASSFNQVEKPTIVHSGGYPIPDGIISSIEILPDDLNTIDPDEDYSDFTTPAMNDEKVNVKIHNFVEKIVNSLAGNFQDLEGVLFRNENKTKLPNQNGIELNNVQVGLVETNLGTKKPSTTTRKPVRRPTPAPEQQETITKITTKRPGATAATATTAPTIVTSKRPFVQISTTKLTTTFKPVRTTTGRPPTIIFSTKKPTSVTVAGSIPTRRPTTKKPRPSTTTKRTTTTTSTTTTTTTTEGATEEAEPPTTSVLDTEEHSVPDYRKECGVRPMVKKGGRIVGGKGSQFGHYPWQVLVRESTWLGLFTKNKCGGVLITHRYVITAAHCQPGFLASLVAVFGEFDISGELESRRSVTKNVRRVIVHRQYDPATFENDLALLELDSPISYDEHIVPICMPRDGEDYTGRMATVTGWGRLKYGGGVPSVLQEVRVPLIDNSVCQEMFQTAGHQKRIISSFLCAGYANGQKDSCEGDSGGPLMVEREDGRWVLLGTVSHGIKCAAPYLPGVYMRTTYYKPWLKSITGVNT